MTRSKSSDAKASGRGKKSKSHVSDENTCPPRGKKPKLKYDSLEECNKENRKIVNRYKCASQSSLPCNILQYCRNNEMGLSCQKYKKPLINSVVNFVKTFELYKVEFPFDRRVTYLLWHPINPHLLAVASHGGDVILYNYEQNIESAHMIKGIGAGGSVQNMKFDPLNPVQLYTVSMEGTFLVLNFETRQEKKFLETNDLTRWYISLDVNCNNRVMVAGDTNGSIAVLTLDGDVINTIQVHKKTCKVSHAEFSKRESWLLCTSSTDKSLKLWDIRSLKKDSHGMAIPLQTIDQEKPINAAYFSLTNGCRLLTTDQKDEINIYRAPLWDLETTIYHPHRQFQHLTPIRAYWHPMEDIVFVGRYPCVDFPGYHENELRTIDFFDAETGDLLHQHSQHGVNGIMSLNRFNITGDALASSYGYRFLIWKPNFKHLDRVSKKEDLLERKKRKMGDSYFDNGGNNDDGNDDDNDDDNDGRFDFDWDAYMKKQVRERNKEKKENSKSDKK